MDTCALEQDLLFGLPDPDTAADPAPLEKDDIFPPVLYYDDPQLNPATKHAPTRTSQPWDPRLVLDLAVGVDDLPTILTRYRLTTAEFDRLQEVNAFRRELAVAMRDVREQGVQFRQKAKVQADAYLMVLDSMVHDPATPPSTRLEAIKSVVRWGDLEPKDKDAKNQPGQNSNINIQINF